MSDRAGPRPWDLEGYRAERNRPVGPTAHVDPEGMERRGLRLGFESDAGRLFWLALGTATLTVLTLGLYRFWMVTRLRRHYWASIRIAGDTMEYTGRGLEKLLGFLLAMVLLALYLSIVQVGLTFVGLSLFSEDPIILNLVFVASAVAVSPLLFYAVYRSSRYILARTRWRGIRFGLGRGAWSYAFRGVFYSIVVTATAGLLYPWMHYRLEKFKADRAWFGNQKFEQTGGWTALFGYWVWLYILIGFIAAGFYTLSLNESGFFGALIISLLLFAAYVSVFIVYLRYQVQAFRHFWNNRTLGGARFTNDIESGDVIGVVIGGSLLVSLCATALVAVVGSILYGILVALGFEQVILDAVAIFAQQQGGSIGPQDFEGPALSDPERQVQLMAVAIAGAVAYLMTIIASYAFTQVFLTRPLLKRKVVSMRINDTQLLADAGQRAHDKSGEAGGFADALGVDVGAGF